MLGMVFPGQGSQSLGMLSDIAKNNDFSIITHTFAEASHTLGYDLWKLVQEGPEDQLNKTEYTQPALLTASIAIWRILTTQTSLSPQLLAGHSLGEYSALVCAQSLKFTDAVTLVAARGKFMQEAVPQGVGSMAAIVGLEDQVIAEICHQACADNEIVTPANLNCPGQIVIAGHTPAVNRAIELAKKHKAKLAKPLAVSAPSHCPLMQPAANNLQKLLANLEIKVPKIKVINNAYVKAYETADEVRQGLVQQLVMPVRWLETIRYFKTQGISKIIECGPGKILTGLNKRIEPEIDGISTQDSASLQQLCH